MISFPSLVVLPPICRKVAKRICQPASRRAKKAGIGYDFRQFIFIDRSRDKTTGLGTEIRMNVSTLADRASELAYAFRGYNTTNLGRSNELLRHSTYRPVVEEKLRQAAACCKTITGKPVDLVKRVEEERETDLSSYDEAVALIVAMELAQIELLEVFFDIRLQSGRLCFGYSLGEIVALAASGVLNMEDALSVPLSLAEDCVGLAKNVTLGILLSRGTALSVEEVLRGCLRINAEGNGVVGPSAFLSPNSMLLMGQHDTLDRLQSWLKENHPGQTSLRKNKQQWPPLHTPIVWGRQIPNRAANLMHTLSGGFSAPQPPILSMVTGKSSYHDHNMRELLHQWVDHPQRLWDVVYEVLSSGIETIIHVGPQPNIIPATFQRLRDNVESQTENSIGMRALSAAVSRPWLQSILPERLGLLRAPQVEHIVLEDWLLEHADEASAS
jgi:[acyl-carrier-protein] S-malonyltransferase